MNIEQTNFIWFVLIRAFRSGQLNAEQNWAMGLANSTSKQLATSFGEEETVAVNSVDLYLLGSKQFNHAWKFACLRQGPARAYIGKCFDWWSWGTANAKSTLFFHWKMIHDVKTLISIHRTCTCNTSCYLISLWIFEWTVQFMDTVQLNCAQVFSTIRRKTMCGRQAVSA